MSRTWTRRASGLLVPQQEPLWPPRRRGIRPVLSGLSARGRHLSPSVGILASAQMSGAAEPQLLTAVGGGTIPAGTSGNVQVTLPFTPEFGFVWISGIAQANDNAALSTTTDARLSFGMFNASQQAGWGGYIDDGADPTDTAGIQRDDSALIHVHSGSYREVQASIQTNAFTLTIGSNGSGTWTGCRFHYFVLGGGVFTNSKISSVTVSAGTGNEAYTSVGFQAAGIITESFNASPNSIAASISHAIGAASGASNQFSWMGMDRDASGTVEANGYFRVGDECSGTIAASNGAVNRRHRFVAFSSNGFTLNRLENSLMGLRYGAIAGPQMHVGSFNSNSAGGTITGVPFDPRGILFISEAKAARNADTPSSDFIWSIGAIDADLNQRVQLVRSIDAQPAAAVELALRGDGVMLRTESGAVTARVSVSSLNSNGFGYTMPTNTHSDHSIGFVAFGDPA